MMVAAEPMLLAQESASTKGIGFKDALIADTQITGVKARQTISLATTAERRAEEKMSAKRNTSGFVTNLTMPKATFV
jgi:hypothetical protein